jgi:hypothetical protein
MCGTEFSGKFCTNCGAIAKNEESGLSTDIPKIYVFPDNRTYRIVTEKENAADVGIGKRSIASCILLTILTCGIYGLYWMGTLNDDANKLCSTPDATSGFAVVLLTILTCGIYGLYWMLRQGEKLENARIQRNMPSGSLSVLYLVIALMSFGIVSLALMQNEINSMVDYTNRQSNP